MILINFDFQDGWGRCHGCMDGSQVRYGKDSKENLSFYVKISPWSIINDQDLSMYSWSGPGRVTPKITISMQKVSVLEEGGLALISESSWGQCWWFLWQRLSNQANWWILILLLSRMCFNNSSIPARSVAGRTMFGFSTLPSSMSSPCSHLGSP